MPEPIPTLLAALVVALFALALWAMSAGNFALAGTSFLSASIAIYFRETRLQEE
jgi:uncharacterized membrane protein